MSVQGILFDVDGTLIASNDAQAQAWVAAFAEAGRTVAYEQVRPLIGMGGDQLMPRVAPGLSPDAEPGKGIAQRRQQIFMERYLPTLRPTPGARDLVAALAARGLRLVVASSAKEQELGGLLHQAGLADLLTEWTTSDDAATSKPAPDVVQVALKKIALPPDAVVFIGDAPYDVQSGYRAGVAVIALRCGGSSDADLAGAMAIYDDPGDLLRHLADTPIGAAEAAGHGTR